jgi:hypothetical protein
VQLLLTCGSALIAVLSLAATWLSGRHRTRVAGLTVALVNVALCAPYNLLTGQYGFLATNVVFAAVGVRNLRHARRERAELTVRR